MIFGTGLVKTVEDFGVTGDLPSHPELLDFLATELIDSGWDVKATLRLIVTSATYRQSSRTTSNFSIATPTIACWPGAPRYRLSAEAGARQRPGSQWLAPGTTWRAERQTVSAGGVVGRCHRGSARGQYITSRGDDLYRRSMYTFWKRTCPPPALMSFDAPNREVCVARRATTNTPLQR